MKMNSAKLIDLGWEPNNFFFFFGVVVVITLAFLLLSINDI